MAQREVTELASELVDLTTLTLAELRTCQDPVLLRSVDRIAERTVLSGSVVLQNQRDTAE